MTDRSRCRPGLAVLFFAGLVGCYRGGDGQADESGEGSTSGSATDGDTEGDDVGDDDGEPAGCEDEVLPGAAPLRRLTNWEYDNTIRDLLGDDSRPSSAFPTDAAAVGFDTKASAQGVSAVLAEAYMRVAEEVAARATADLGALLPCDPSAGEVACGEAFVDGFGARAYRRPLADDERALLVGLFTASRDQYGFAKAIELVLQAMLQSPEFLYRIELGMPDPDAAEAVRLTHYEVASRLSYLLWGSMPDDALLQAAADEALGTREEVAAQAQRLLAEPRARQAVANFHWQWLRLGRLDALDKDPGVYPDFDDALKASMQAESVAFLEDVVFDGAGDFATMFTADYSIVDGHLAQLYGVAGPAGDAFERVDLDPTQRAGILTHASILAATGKRDQSSPVLRGVFVLEQLLCDAPPEPPPNVDTTPPELDPSSTTRERFEQHMADPLCFGCHSVIDPIGFGFEHYDGIGRWRESEGALAIDARGQIPAGPGGDIVEFDGVLELAGVFAESPVARECFVESWFTYGHGRSPEGEDDCSVTRLRNALDDAGGDVQSLLLELTQTEAFLYRPPREGQ